MNKFYFTVEHALIDEKFFPLEDRLTIGRADDSDIKLPHSSVSRRHAVVQIVEGKPILKDQGSTNGTFVNGEQVDTAVLYNGDKLRVGEVYLRFFQGVLPPKEVEEKTVLIRPTSLYQLSPEDLQQIKTIQHELEKGRQIQKGFLPDQIPTLPDWESATYFRPARQMAGDFYDAFLLPGGYLGFVIADVCDKGAGSALFMSMIRSLIRVFSGQTRLPGFSISAVEKKISHAAEESIDSDHFNPLKAVALTNDYIAQEHGQMCMFATLFLGVLNPTTGFLAYINGGHEPLLVLGSDGIRESLEPTGPAVGMKLHMEFRPAQVRLEPGEILLGYTDGVTEARAPSGELFTRKRLLAVLEQPAFSALELLDLVKTNLFGHIGDAELFDDITIMALRRIRAK